MSYYFDYLSYFCKRFINDENFRKIYLTKELRRMTANEKMLNKAIFCWKFHSAFNRDLILDLKIEFVQNEINQRQIILDKLFEKRQIDRRHSL